jgi:hypothetical protein
MQCCARLHRLHATTTAINPCVQGVPNSAIFPHTFFSLGKVRSACPLYRVPCTMTWPHPSFFRMFQEVIWPQ